LAIGKGINAQDPMPGGLRLARRNTNLLLEHMIHQCGFTHIWAAN
jgi:hypothetical protein